MRFQALDQMVHSVLQGDEWHFPCSFEEVYVPFDCFGILFLHQWMWPKTFPGWGDNLFLFLSLHLIYSRMTKKSVYGWKGAGTGIHKQSVLQAAAQPKGLSRFTSALAL